MRPLHPCPICKNLTFYTPRDIGDICSVCFWEMEGGEGERTDINEPEYGPNGDLSIAQARKNYEKFGAVEKNLIPYVRQPTKSEKPSS